MLLISETFLSIQGEGPSAGERAFFIRTGTCNLHCVWCDTAYTWAFTPRQAALHQSKVKYNPKEELRRIETDALAAEIESAGVTLCVVTGGEPMLQRGHVGELIAFCHDELPTRFEIETAGTISPGDLNKQGIVSYNVSPKLATSGNSHNDRYVKEVLEEFAHAADAIFKFVIDTRPVANSLWRDDIAEVTTIINDVGIEPSNVWLMPCGTTVSHLLHGMRLLAPVALENGWNLTNRMHVEIWGSERGH